MKKMLLITMMLVAVQLINAQTSAITESGDEVILYNDGTWKYINEPTIEESKILLNPKEFTKPIKSTFLVKSQKLNVGIWIDPKKWSFTKKEVNDVDALEYQFLRKGGDMYAMFISEKIEIPLETLKVLAVKIGKKAAPDLKVIKEEYRMINGKKVLMLQMSGTLQGIKFNYYGYYYSNSNGTIQLVSYCGESSFKEYMPEMEAFLNGLVDY